MSSDKGKLHLKNALDKLQWQAYIVSMLKTYKYRIYATSGKLRALENTLEICRATYNKLLEVRKLAFETAKQKISCFDCNKLLTQWQIAGVHSQVLQNISKRLDLAFQNFFRRCKEKQEDPGFPRFKGKNRYDSFTYPQFGFKLNGNKLQLSGIGHVKLKLHRALEGTIKTCTIKKEGTNWYVTFAVEVQKVARTKSEISAIGIDMGCVDFATFSDGSSIPNPHYLRASSEKLKKVQQKVSAKKHLPVENKGKIRAKKALTVLHFKVRNQRHDFLHKLSRICVETYSHICVEKLNIKGMLQSNFKSLNRSISDSGWGTFRQMLNCKAEEAGSCILEVDPAFTSQMCSNCGILVPKELHVRVHDCSCGLRIGRDINAAKNILTLGLKSLSAVAKLAG